MYKIITIVMLSTLYSNTCTAAAAKWFPSLFSSTALRTKSKAEQYEALIINAIRTDDLVELRRLLEDRKNKTAEIIKENRIKTEQDISNMFPSDERLKENVLDRKCVFEISLRDHDLLYKTNLDNGAAIICSKKAVELFKEYGVSNLLLSSHHKLE